MQAVILAGGKGKRLMPYTTVFPKPLVPIGDYPILEVIIMQLKYFDFTDIIITVGHLKELFYAFFQDGKKWGLNITYSIEEGPLGTAAPLKLIKDLEPNFLVINGDILCNLNYGEFYNYHKEKKATCTIGMYKRIVGIDYGILKVDTNHDIIDYIEKPKTEYNVSMGVYAFQKSVLDFLPYNKYFDFPELVKVLLKNKRIVSGYEFSGKWLDIGRPDDYEHATEVFKQYKYEFLKNHENIDNR